MSISFSEAKQFLEFAQFYELAVCSRYFASTFVVFDGFVHDGQRLVSPTDVSLEKDFYSKENESWYCPGLGGEDVVIELDL